MAFLHLLPAASTLWLLAAQGSIDLSAPFSPRALRGAAPSAALSAARLYLVLVAAPRCSLWLLICWSVMVPLGVRAAAELAGDGGGGPRPAGPLAGLALGLAATAGALAVGLRGPGGTLALLLWAVVEAAAAGWEALRGAPDRAAALLGGEERAAPLRAAAEAEASLGPATLAFLQAALPLLPLLALGFATGEGSELVNHELSGGPAAAAAVACSGRGAELIAARAPAHAITAATAAVPGLQRNGPHPPPRAVPAVTKILISVVCWAAVATCGLLTSNCLTRTARVALVAAAPLGTVVIEAAVHGVAAGQALGLAAAVVAAAAGLGLQLATVTRQLL